MCGRLGTYEDTVLMPLAGKVRNIDRCIHGIVAALNAGGIETAASCCGHGKQVGNILLADGRTLLILPAHPDPAVSWIDTPACQAERAATGVMFPEQSPQAHAAGDGEGDDGKGREA